MIGTALLMMISTPTAGEPMSVAEPARVESRSCREMLFSSSRLGKVKVCKTRAEWRRWDSCHSSVTRYCTPKKTTVRVAGLKPNDRLVCKYIAETGTRIGRQRLCATKREWDLAERQTQDEIKNRQMQSMLAGTQTIFRNPSDGITIQ